MYNPSTITKPTRYKNVVFHFVLTAHINMYYVSRLSEVHFFDVYIAVMHDGVYDILHFVVF